MKLKLNKDGSAVARNGKPVYVNHDGSEIEIDGAAAMRMVRNQAFAASKFVADKLTIPAELAASAFGDAFVIEGDKLVAHAPGGVPLYSHVRPGELASVEEAIEQLVAGYRNKAQILRQDGAAAPGQQPQGGAAPGKPHTGKVITREAFDAMPPIARANFINGGGRIGDVASGPAPAPTPAPAAPKGAITRAQFDAMAPMARAAHFKAGGTMVDD
jgi:hypothetical protein